MEKKTNEVNVIKDIKRHTIKRYNSEEKIVIVL